MTTRNTRLVQSLEFLEVLKFAQQFSRAGKKVWKMKIKSGKMVKSLEFVFFLVFQSYNKCFSSEMFSVLVKSYSISPVRLQNTMQNALFLRFFMSLLITYLLTLSLEKEIIVLEKSLEEVLNFGSKNLYEPW